MANELLHRTEVVEQRKVAGLSALKAALIELDHDYSLELDRLYVVEVIAEHLSDGSVVHELRIRPRFGDAA